WVPACTRNTIGSSILEWVYGHWSIHPDVVLAWAAAAPVNSSPAAAASAPTAAPSLVVVMPGPFLAVSSFRRLPVRPRGAGGAVGGVQGPDAPPHLGERVALPVGAGG